MDLHAILFDGISELIEPFNEILFEHIEQDISLITLF